MADVKVTLDPASTPEEVIFNFEIPGGEKGDPGGIVDAAVLPAGTDLNNIQSRGTYRGVGSNVTMQLNFPKEGMGCVVVVLGNGGVLTQIVYPLNNTGGARYHFQRSMVTSSWSPWQTFSSTRVDQTAGRAIYQWDDLNNREQLIYGDTGWRNFATELLNGWSASNMFLRRVGQTVYMRGYYLSAVSATADIFYKIPQGFKQTISGLAVTVPDTSTAAAVVEVTSGADCKIWGRTAKTYFQAQYFEFSWVTSDPWPTTLPGTASGTIPNL